MKGYAPLFGSLAELEKSIWGSLFGITTKNKKINKKTENENMNENVNENNWIYESHLVGLITRLLNSDPRDGLFYPHQTTMIDSIFFSHLLISCILF